MQDCDFTMPQLEVVVALHQKTAILLLFTCMVFHNVRATEKLIIYSMAQSDFMLLVAVTMMSPSATATAMPQC